MRTTHSLDRADPPTSWHSVWSFQEFANKKLTTLGKGSVLASVLQADAGVQG